MTNRLPLSPLDALADPTRRAVLEALRAGPMPVGVLASRFPVSRPAVSQHLAALKRARLVRDRAVGTRRLYELDPAGLAELRAYVESFWRGVLGAFVVDAQAGTDRDHQSGGAAR